MSDVYFTSDWHLGHRNITKYRTVFKTEEQHAEFILKSYLSTIRRNDVIWFLGDICFTDDYIEHVAALPGRKRLVMGNHELERGNDWERYLRVFDRVYGMAKYKGFWLTHCPIHPKELRGKYNIHGHTHETNIDDGRYYNVSLDQGQVLFSLNEIRTYFEIVNNFSQSKSGTAIKMPEHDLFLNNDGTLEKVKEV